MLVGAATVLVLLVAVFLAYNANTGLPFVPTRELKVDIVNGSNLTVGNDVREGGYRIGLVSGWTPIELSSGQVGAQLTLKLTPSTETCRSIRRSRSGRCRCSAPSTSTCTRAARPT